MRNYKGIKRILKAFQYSYQGFTEAFKSEIALRQDVFICTIGFIFICLISFDLLAKALMISSLIFIIFAELVNTALEKTIDRISDEIHPLSKIVKDIGSCLVLFSFLNAFIIFGIIFYKYFIVL